VQIKPFDVKTKLVVTIANYVLPKCSRSKLEFETVCHISLISAFAQTKPTLLIMKNFLIITLVLAVFAMTNAVKGNATTALPAEECQFCSNGVGDNNDCVCSYSNRVGRKYACGPGCDAFGYCCESIGKCPSCTGKQNPTADGECTCDAPSIRIFRKFPCGPACTAAGYCCDTSTVETTRKKKCFVVDA
jgi:hypothetical protein